MLQDTCRSTDALSKTTWSEARVVPGAVLYTTRDQANQQKNATASAHAAVAHHARPRAIRTSTRPRESPITHRTALVDRDARYLQAARRGALSAVTEYGAVRYLVDRSGKFRSYLGAPPPELFTTGLLRYRSDGVSLELTSAGSTALDAYLEHKAALDALPYTLTRNPLREELHRADEPIRILRETATGREIAPGATLTDPSGHPVTYLGPTMSSDDRGATWRPTFTARVSYPDHGAWLYPPAALGAAYDAEPAAPDAQEPR